MHDSELGFEKKSKRSVNTKIQFFNKYMAEETKRRKINVVNEATFSKLVILMRWTA